MSIGLLALGQPALAQSSSVVGNETLSRPRPGLDAIGLPLGGFRLFPMIRGSVGYDDNIYNVDRDVRKSAIFSLQPSLELRSNWNAHRLQLGLQAVFERYASLRSENNNQYTGSLSGQLDVTRNFRIEGQSHARRAIETRGTAGDVLTRGEPVHFDDVGGTIVARRDSNGVVLQLSGGLNRTVYRDVRFGTLRVDQGYRDRRSTDVGAQLGYHLSPGVIAFVSGSRQWERYDRRASAIMLDSEGYRVLGGLRFGVTRLISGEVGGGYLHRKSRYGTFDAASGFAYDGALIWNPTTLATLTFRGHKSIEESPTLLASGIVTDRGSVELDYEPLRNILVNARVELSGENYRGIDRRDRRVGAGLGLRYLANRFAEIGLGYDHRRQRGRGIAGRDYTGNEIRFTLTVQR